MTKLSSGLPKDIEQNGLHTIGRELLEDPLKKHVVIAVVNCGKITTDTDTGAREPTVRILRIEAINPADITEAERLVRRALEYRKGDSVLPIDIERDLEDWFGVDTQVDPETGEIILGNTDTNTK